VATPEDLKRLTIHAWAGNSTYVEAWKRFGFRALPLPSTEIMTGLQSGLISAVTAPPLAALAFQWFGLAPHMTDLRWAPLEGAIVLSNEAWQRIPQDLRPAIEQAAREACAQLERNLQDLSQQAVDVMKTHGLTVHPVSPEQYKAWEEAVKDGYGFIASTPSQIAIAEQVRQLRDEYRSTHAAQ
jgi:TRAP-type C4-dicarboxylate transport system substrate-binding protein